VTSDRVLASGVRLVADSSPDARSAALCFFVGVGSRDEREDQAGCSHFLEHLVFKGTVDMDAQQVAEATDLLGGEFNAFTTKEYTGFHLRVLPEDLADGVSLLGRLFFEPALFDSDVELERQVIVEEVLAHLDDPGELCQEAMFEAMYGSHPLARDPLGTLESVSALTRDEIASFFAQRYRPAQVVVASAGAVDVDWLAELVDRQAEAWVRRSPGFESVGPVRTAPPRAAGGLVVTERDDEQVQIAMGLAIPGREDPTVRPTLALIDQILGGGVSSRLFQQIRESRGLAYSVYSERVTYQDCGVLILSAGTAPEKVVQVVETMHDELERLATEKVSEVELDRAKRSLYTQLALASEDVLARMSRIGRSALLHGEIMDLEMERERLLGVDAASILEVARRWLEGPVTLSVAGPVSAAELAGFKVGGGH
jgi:predicted Zn-dependent peptidase